MAQRLGQVVLEQAINPAAWMTQAPGKKPKGLKRIEHPIFLEAAKLVTDEYWIERLTEMAGGKFLSGFSVRDGELRYKQGNKTSSIPIPLDPPTAMSKTINFMREFFVKSPLDRENDAKKVMFQSVVHQNWKQMSKGMRHHALCDYVSRLVPSTNRVLLDQCYELLKRGLGDKRITADHVTCVENRIHSINGLRFEDGAWYLDPIICPAPRVPHSKVKTAPLEVEYEKDQIPQTWTKLSKFVGGLAKKSGGNMSQVEISDVESQAGDDDDDLE